MLHGTGGGGGEFGNIGSELAELFGTGGGGTARALPEDVEEADGELEENGGREPSLPPVVGTVPVWEGGGGTAGIVVRTYLSGIGTFPFGLATLDGMLPLLDAPGNGGRGTVSAAGTLEKVSLPAGVLPLASVLGLTDVPGREVILLLVVLGIAEVPKLWELPPGTEPVG